MHSNLEDILTLLTKVGYPSPLAVAKEIHAYLEDNDLTNQQINLIFEELKSGKPWEYICGYATFRNNRYVVSADTLIPRVETERLVDLAVSSVKNYFAKKPETPLLLIDVGTGTGCIIIELYKELEAQFAGQITYFATDISQPALEIAQKNATTLLGSNTVKFIQADILPDSTPLLKTNKDTIIVSNPPYIPTKTYQALDRSVVSFEPRSALDGGNDGLDLYRKLLEKSQSLTKLQALILEADEEINDSLVKLAQSHGYKAERHKDLYEHARFILLSK